MVQAIKSSFYPSYLESRLNFMNNQNIVINITNKSPLEKRDTFEQESSQSINNDF